MIESSKTPEHRELERMVPVVSEQLAEIRGDANFLKSHLLQIDSRISRMYENVEKKFHHWKAWFNANRLFLEKSYVR